MFRKHNNLGFMKSNSINKIPSKVESDPTKEAIESYHGIYDQILDEFSVDESLEKQRKFDEDIAMLKLDFIISGNKMKRTLFRLKEAEQPKIEGSDVKYDFSKEIGLVSKSMGSGIIDIKNTTIHQYHTALNLLKNG